MLRGAAYPSAAVNIPARQRGPTASNPRSCRLHTGNQRSGETPAPDERFTARLQPNVRRQRRFLVSVTPQSSFGAHPNLRFHVAYLSVWKSRLLRGFCCDHVTVSERM